MGFSAITRLRFVESRSDKTLGPGANMSKGTIVAGQAPRSLNLDRIPDSTAIRGGMIDTGMVRVRGARVHNLQDVSVDLPRGAFVVFTGVSGSGKSSLAFSTIFAESQRRYLESVAPYARRLFHQLDVPEVDSIDGLPPAVALQQQRGTPTTRSTVGSVTTLSNLLRMLYSRTGDYPPGQEHLDAEAFSANTPAGACPKCHGLGQIYEVTEKSMVPDDSLSIRDRAIAAWPTAWGGQNLRDILVSLGYDVDRPWRDLPKKDRDWILFTDEQPQVPVYPGLTPEETRRALKRKAAPDYIGNFSSAKRQVLTSFANTESAMMKKRALRYMISSPCPLCHGKRLNRAALTVTFAGFDIAEISRLPLKELSSIFRPWSDRTSSGWARLERERPEKALALLRIAKDFVSRLNVLLELGLGYLSLERSTPTLSPGELQRLRLATQIRSNLFGVVYVLDEPSAGLHPADTEALLRALDQLKAAGNTILVVEHELDVIRHADWIIDVGPDAGLQGGRVLYSGPPDGLRAITDSRTRTFLFEKISAPPRLPRSPVGWLKLAGVSRNNLRDLEVAFPLGVLTSVTGISGSGKSSLVSQVLIELVANALGQKTRIEGDEEESIDEIPTPLTGQISTGIEHIDRMVRVDQKPIGRTPRSNLATYTGLFDQVRTAFSRTPEARARRFNAGRFSFNVPQGRCPTCEGEGFVMVELLFLPSAYAPCPTCHGTRYNASTLSIKYRGRNIAEVLAMTVDDALAFFSEEQSVHRSLQVLHDVGLGYLRIGQPATELSGGEAQRIKLATELQRGARGHTLFILDEPTNGLHPSDVEKLLAQLDRLVDSKNTVIVVEHDLRVVAASDWVIDLGPGAGDEGGRIVVAGIPSAVANEKSSRTGIYLSRQLSV